MGTYYKYLRLACEKATGGKIFDSRKGLTAWRAGCCGSLRKSAASLGRNARKGVIYVEDLAVIMQTNLTTTKKKYTNGRHRIQLALFLQLAGFSGNRPQAVLSLCYRHIIVTLLQDPNGGPHNILIEFTYEFTKQFLGTKEINTFPVPEVIFDPSLVLSPHVALLGLLLADKAFLAPGLMSAHGFNDLVGVGRVEENDEAGKIERRGGHALPSPDLALTRRPFALPSSPLIAHAAPCVALKS